MFQSCRFSSSVSLGNCSRISLRLIADFNFIVISRSRKASLCRPAGKRRLALARRRITCADAYVQRGGNARVKRLCLIRIPYVLVEPDSEFLNLGVLDLATL